MDENRLSVLLVEHSLADVEQVNVYWKWLDASSPFTHHLSSGLIEKLWFAEEVKVYEEYSSTTGCKFGFDPEKSTYFYESWEPQLLVKVWKNPDMQWGELQQSHHSVASTEKWSVSPSEKTYEIYQFEGKRTKSGRKFGAKEGVKWYEKWHERKEDSLLEKWWEQTDRSWGEITGFFHGKKWSERWEKHGDEFLLQKVGEEKGKKWSSMEGRQGTETWGENWTYAVSGEVIHERTWASSQKRWGVWSTTKGEESIIKDWEECLDNRKKKVTIRDGTGKETQKVTGSGKDYDYVDIYEKLPDGSHATKKKGYSGSNSWSLRYHFENPGVHRVKYKGKNEEGSWIEIWSEGNGTKSAYKAGNKTTREHWEESWLETSDGKECYKHGKSLDDEWWEQWEETTKYKHCKKRQKNWVREAVQEWTEDRLGALRRTRGYYEENGEKVREWDEVLDS